MTLSGQTTGRIPFIDILRGIAILLVLVLHFNLSYQVDQIQMLSWVPKSILEMFFYNGNYGVTIFFVISGYLITRTTQARWGGLGNIDTFGFYVNRFARIIPPLIAAVTIIVLLGLADISSFTNSDNGNDLPNSYYFKAAGSVLTFWHNVLMQKMGYFNYALNIYWSLSVEEVFYLGFPLICIMLSRQRWVLIACMILIVVGPFYRAQHSDNDLYYMYGYFACFDAIAFGVATALLSSSVPRKGLHVLFIQIFAALLLVFTFWQGIHEHEILGFSQIAIGTSLLLMFQPDKVEFDGLISQGLRSMGRCSYEIYLFHIILLGLLRTAIPRLEMDDSVKLIWFVAYILASALLGELISRYYSEPINKILRINFGRRKPEILLEDRPAP